MTAKKTPFLDPETWIRFAYMVLFSFLLVAARIVVAVVAVAQLLLVLITGVDNENLRNLGQGIGKWIYQAIMFLTFNSEQKPFPFDEWPEINPTEGYSVAVAEDVEDGEYVEVEPVEETSSASAGGSNSARDASNGGTRSD